METYNDDSIREWNKDKLAQEAESLFGLKFTKNMSKDDMIEAFLDARDNLSNQAEESNGTDSDMPRVAGKRRVRIIFHNQDGPGGSDDIFVSVNGRAYLIKREHEVRLPLEVMRVVENAEQSLFERGADNRLREKLVKRYSFTILGEAA